MNFMKKCASRLDEGEDAEEVLRDVRERYKTIRCVNVKTCLIRKMCRLSSEFVTSAAGNEDILSGAQPAPPDFPSRYPKNVEAFKISRSEMRECKRLSARSALEKNRKVRRVNGRDLLSVCRQEVDAVANGSRQAGPMTILCMMLLTGRRTCEIANGKSSLNSMGDYAVSFTGQAKRRRLSGETYTVPCLHDASTVEIAFEKIKEWTTIPLERDGVSENQMVSQKYQSWLRRTLLDHPVLQQVGKVHALRGLYARMAYRLFEWQEDYSEAFVVMQILGHLSLSESLVYTSFHLGDFTGENVLGAFTLERFPLTAEDKS